MELLDEEAEQNVLITLLLERSLTHTQPALSSPACPWGLFLLGSGGYS